MVMAEGEEAGPVARGQVIRVARFREGPRPAPERALLSVSAIACGQLGRTQTYSSFQRSEDFA